MKIGDLVRYHVAIRMWSEDFTEYMDGIGLVMFVGHTDIGDGFVDVLTVEGLHETFHEEDVEIVQIGQKMSSTK